MIRTRDNLEFRPKEGLFTSLHLGPLAQSVEQQTFNLWVVGSIPTGPTTEINSKLYKLSTARLVPRVYEWLTVTSWKSLTKA